MAELLDPGQFALNSDTDVRFSHLVGQPHVRDVLSRAVHTGRIAHAWLFLGEEGSGREAAALDFARALFCISDAQRRHESCPVVPCDSCDGCVQSARLAHPGLKILFPQPKPQPPKEGEEGIEAVELYTAAQQKQSEAVLAAKSADFYAELNVPGGSEILIEHIRALRREFILTSFSGGWRVVLISQADRIRVQAANAFLKLLEEPPPNVVFLLTSSRESRLLPTIVSRCQILRFPRLDRETLRRELMNRLSIPDDKADAAARLAGGSWKQAVAWARGNPAEETLKVVELLRDLLRNDPGRFDQLVDHWGSASRSDDFARLLHHLTQWLRDVQRYDSDPNSAPELEKDQHLVKFALFTEGRPFEDALAAIDEARLDIERNVQTTLIAHTLFRALQHSLFRQSSAHA